MSTFCTPILLYAAEVLEWNKKSLRSLENAYSRFKIVTTFDKNVVQQCQFYMGLLPINLLIDLRKLNFLSDIWTNIAEVNAMSSLHHLAKWTDRDFNSLMAKINLSIQDEILTNIQYGT